MQTTFETDTGTPESVGSELRDHRRSARSVVPFDAIRKTQSEVEFETYFFVAPECRRLLTFGADDF